MDVHATTDMRRHEAALRAVQKPPAKPWRGAGTGTSKGAVPPPAPPPPKVYRVEAREFRDLVQRLTGAAPRQDHLQMPAEDHQHQQQLYDAPSWFSFPMDAHHGNGGALM